MTRVRDFRVTFGALGLFATANVCADPWLAPGDERIRHDIELLADAGILRGPVTAWPLSWPDISRDVTGLNVSDIENDALVAALVRVQRRARDESSPGFSAVGLRVSGTNEPEEVRRFATTPRAKGEGALEVGWLSDHFAANAQVTVATDPSDGDELRPDGSYLGMNIGNFNVSAGYMDRWWGPGWDGSLILSTNARPMPTLTIERNYTTPFRVPVLRWLGPWRASVALGVGDRRDIAVPDSRFMAARVTFRPQPWLEIGVSRTAQWCGDGRPCDASTFADLLIGRDNRDESLDINDEPGNQLAGYDVRLRSPWLGVPVAFYSQWIGEDEAGGLPSKFLGQIGLETWWMTPAGGWRAHVEYSDTTCAFTRSDPEFGCGYRNSLYPQGYSFRGRIIGHSMDNDSRMYSLGVLLVRTNGDYLSATVRRVEINRDGGPHAISTEPRNLGNVELRYSRTLSFGDVMVGLGFDDKDRPEDGSALRVYLGWQRGIR
jgi:hypothetical protein